MSTETTEKMIENIYCDLENGDSLTLAFQGGEPTLVGLKYFQHLVECVESQTKNVSVNYALQTNGTTLNKRWCQFFKDYNFLIGLSIDGTDQAHNRNRVDTSGRGTFERVIYSKRLLDEFGVDYNVLCVLTQEISAMPDKVFDFLISEKIDYIQFIPCLDDLDAQEPGEFALQPEQFASFYIRIMELWLQRLDMEHYLSVKLFDDMWNLLVRRQATFCGALGNCQIQYVIEADGSVYPCDFYVLDKYRLGNIRSQTLKELFSQNVAQYFLCEQPTESKYCSVCPFSQICRGGCKRMKEAMYVNRSETMCGYQTVLQAFMPQIPYINKKIRKILTELN